MNKKLLAIAGAVTAFVLAVLVGTLSVAANQTETAHLMGTSSWSEKLLNELGIKSQAQLNAQIQSNNPAPAMLPEPILAQATPIESALVIPEPERAAKPKSSTTAAVINNSDGATNNPAAALSTNAISAQQARLIAQRAAPNSQVTGTPDLVLYAGQTAYEVVMGTGQVYVDANSGAVLDNTAITTAKRSYNDDDEYEKNERNKKYKNERHEQERNHDDDDDEDHRA